MNVIERSLLTLMNEDDIEYIRQSLETLPSNPSQIQRSNLIAKIRCEMLQRYPTSFLATGNWHNEIIHVADTIKPDWRGYLLNGTNQE